MSDETTKEPTNAELSEEIRKLNEANGTSFPVSGNKDALLASLAEAQAYKPEGSQEGADGADTQGDGQDGSEETTAAPDDLVALGTAADDDGDEAAIARLREMAAEAELDDDEYDSWGDLAQALEAKRTEGFTPSINDVLGGGDGNTDPNALSLDQVDPANLTSIDASGTVKPADGEIPSLGTELRSRASEANILGAASKGEMTGPDGEPLPQRNPEPADVAGPDGAGGTGVDTRAIAFAARDRADAAMRAGQFPQGDMPSDEGRAASLEDEAPLYAQTVSNQNNLVRDRIIAYGEANPEATVIPPSLLPPTYQDATIATPGLPPL